MGMADQPPFKCFPPDFGMALEGQAKCIDNEGLMGDQGSAGQCPGPSRQIVGVPVPVEHGMAVSKNGKRRLGSFGGQEKGGPANFRDSRRIDPGSHGLCHQLGTKADPYNRFFCNQPFFHEGDLSGKMGVEPFVVGSDRSSENDQEIRLCRIQRFEGKHGRLDRDNLVSPLR